MIRDVKTKMKRKDKQVIKRGRRNKTCANGERPVVQHLVSWEVRGGGGNENIV